MTGERATGFRRLLIAAAWRAFDPTGRRSDSRRRRGTTGAAHTHKPSARYRKSQQRAHHATSRARGLPSRLPGFAHSRGLSIASASTLDGIARRRNKAIEIIQMPNSLHYRDASAALRCRDRGHTGAASMPDAGTRSRVRDRPGRHDIAVAASMPGGIRERALWTLWARWNSERRDAVPSWPRALASGIAATPGRVVGIGPPRARPMSPDLRGCAAQERGPYGG